MICLLEAGILSRPIMKVLILVITLCNKPVMWQEVQIESLETSLHKWEYSSSIYLFQTYGATYKKLPKIPIDNLLDGMCS